jgi:tetratricopeptide (TPR) repeat protein
MKHRDEVEAVAFSPNGKTIVTGSTDNTARLWYAASGQPVGRVMRHHGDVRSVAFSPDGRTIVTGSRDDTARLWDAASGQPVGPPLQHAARSLAVGGQTDAYRVFDMPILDVIVSQSADTRMSVAFSPEGKTVLTGSSSAATARLWDTPAQLPDDPPRLAAWVQTLTGLELDEQGAPHMLDPVGWRKCRDLLRRLGGPPLADSDRLLQPVRSGPDPTARAHAWAQRGGWAEMDATLLQEEQFEQPIDDESWIGRILALSAAGARCGLRRLVSDLLERFRETTRPSTANLVAWNCGLAPDAVVEPEVLVRLAEFAVKGYPKEERHSALNTLGAALYRAGRFEEAIRRLEEGIRLRSGGTDPEDWVFLAMAHHRLGHRDEARRWLDRFRSHRPQRVAPETRLLHSEAEAVVLYDPAFPADPFAH